MWNAGNDGSGSGLDADLLDGIDSASFLRIDVADTATKITFGQGNVTAPSPTDSSTGARIILYPSGSGRDYALGIESSTMWFNSDDHYKWYVDGSLKFEWDNTAGQLEVGGNKVWHAGNDGSGSGLDADTVDGLQASQFIRSDANDTATGVVTFSDRIQAHEIRTNTGQELILNAGESANVATGQTGEYVYVNAEGGLQINTSPDNWNSGWAGRDTFTINGSGLQFPDGTTQTTAATADEQDYGLITGAVTASNDYGALT